jgi:hypothetical protein
MPSHFQAYGAQVQAWMPYRESPTSTGNHHLSHPLPEPVPKCRVGSIPCNDREISAAKQLRR